MKTSSRNAIVCLGTVLPVAIASVSSAQPSPTPEQQEYANRLRNSHLVGANDSLAIEMPDGKLVPLGRGHGCVPPATQAGVIKVDCTPTDGPAYYFDEATRAMIEVCSFWFPEPKLCPPKQWPVEVEGCDGVVPKSVTGTWRLHAMPSSNGFYPISGGWTMTFAERSIHFDFDVKQLMRPYTVIESGDGKYTIEIGDASTSTTTIGIELAACGILVEAEGRCDAFCENFTREFGPPTEAGLRAMIAKNFGGNVPEPELQRIFEEITNQPPPSLFSERAYFRAVADD